VEKKFPFEEKGRGMIERPSFIKKRRVRQRMSEKKQETDPAGRRDFCLIVGKTANEQ